MIEKNYEISCDNCNNGINHTFYKSTIKDLKEDNIICYKGKQFCCEECLEEYKRAHKKECGYFYSYRRFCYSIIC